MKTWKKVATLLMAGVMAIGMSGCAELMDMMQPLGKPITGEEAQMLQEKMKAANFVQEKGMPDMNELVARVNDAMVEGDTEEVHEVAKMIRAHAEEADKIDSATFRFAWESGFALNCDLQSEESAVKGDIALDFWLKGEYKVTEDAVLIDYQDSGIKTLVNMDVTQEGEEEKQYLEAETKLAYKIYIDETDIYINFSEVSLSQKSNTPPEGEETPETAQDIQAEGPTYVADSKFDEKFTNQWFNFDHIALKEFAAEGLLSITQMTMDLMMQGMNAMAVFFQEYATQDVFVKTSDGNYILTRTGYNNYMTEFQKHAVDVEVDENVDVAVGMAMTMGYLNAEGQFKVLFNEKEEMEIQQGYGNNLSINLGTIKLNGDISSSATHGFVDVNATTIEKPTDVKSLQDLILENYPQEA